MGNGDERDHSNTLAGWREWVQLPTIDVPWIKAKLDTGAQTSSLHAFDLEEFTRDGADWVRFRVRPWQQSLDDEVPVECPVHDRRRVRSSSGHVQDRLVVLLPIVLMGLTIAAEVTLSNRDAMGFRMLIGREALRSGVVVDSGRAFLGGRPPKAIRRRNRGKPSR
jgi:hypothetical protein